MILSSSIAPIIPRLLIASFAVILLALAGCSSAKRKTATISGKVTYKGEPVTVGAIYFHGSDGQVGMGNIGSDGRFTATDVPLGEVRVSLQVRDPGGYAQQLKTSRDPMAKKPDVAPGGIRSIPAKYADPNTSGLKYPIGANAKNFDVTLE